MKVIFIIITIINLFLLEFMIHYYDDFQSIINYLTKIQD